MSGKAFAVFKRVFADFDRSDVLVIGGTISTSYGLAMISWSAAWIFAGLVALLLGMLPALAQLLNRRAA